MEKCLSDVSKSLIEDINKLKIRLPFKINDKFIHLEKYFLRFREKYNELDTKDIETYNLQSSIVENSHHNIPCNTLNILRYIKNNKDLLDEIYETHD